MDSNVEKMIEDNKRLVYSIANSMYRENKLFSKDDLIQVGFLALCKSGHKYDETRGKVSTFITHCVRNDILKFIKSNKMQGELLYSENKNLSYENEELSCLDYNNFFCTKTDLERKIVKLKINGATNKKVALELETTPNKISRILRIMKKRMDRKNNV